MSLSSAPPLPGLPALGHIEHGYYAVNTIITHHVNKKFVAEFLVDWN